MLILVTGGAGFIGSNFIRYILGQHPGWKVISADRAEQADEKNLDDSGVTSIEHGVRSR